MTYEFRLANGWISAAALNASSAYLIENFPVQSDQNPWSQPWGPPIDHKAMYPRRARTKSAMDYSQASDGFWQFDWLFAYWTEGMIAYFETLFFPYLGSSLVTVKTIRRTGLYQVYQGSLWYPESEEFFDPSERGVENYRLRFRGLTEV